MLDKQVVDWNRGDMESFATGYKNSPDILFMGSKISRGYAQMLDTYRNSYSTKEKMGILNFTDLEVQPLDEHFATVTGNFHFERTAAGGGNADGYFLLVVREDARRMEDRSRCNYCSAEENYPITTGSPECEGVRCRENIRQSDKESSWNIVSWGDRD